MSLQLCLAAAVSCLLDLLLHPPARPVWAAAAIGWIGQPLAVEPLCARVHFFCGGVDPRHHCCVCVCVCAACALFILFIQTPCFQCPARSVCSRVCFACSAFRSVDTLNVIVVPCTGNRAVGPSFHSELGGAQCCNPHMTKDTAVRTAWGGGAYLLVSPSIAVSKQASKQERERERERAVGVLVRVASPRKPQNVVGGPVGTLP